MVKKIAFVLTNTAKLGDTGKQTGWYLPEVAHPYHVWKEAGFEMEFITPLGGVAPCDEGSITAFAEDKICTDFLGNSSVTAADDKKSASINVTTKAEDALARKDEYDAVFFAGGHGPMWDTPDCVALQALSTAVYEKNGVVSAVCHGPCGLVNIKLTNGDHLVKGKEVTCFTNAEEEAVGLTSAMPFLVETVLRERGATFKAADNWQANVVVSDRLVTGQNPASATGVGEAVAKLLA
eukprot:TRINITY_DN11378_c0_g1_i1.p1 TRINITY_DN11378_c0_g1~~TRINITY_DN11378_c0_g1_i1.p1  ORF type:complete len:249 (+),score=69.13 TRINITY_DN11378_c0_g1_i1:38-748(+)